MEEKEMKHTYQKPQISVEKLTLDTAVSASSCQGASDYAIALEQLGFFRSDMACMFTEDMDAYYGDPICYMTAVATFFWS